MESGISRFHFPVSVIHSSYFLSLLRPVSISIMHILIGSLPLPTGALSARPVNTHSRGACMCMQPRRRKVADLTFPFRPLCLLHHCFIPSVRMSNQLSLQFAICISCPASVPVQQVECFTPVVSAEDVGYPATLAVRGTSGLVRLMSTCCSLWASHRRHIAVRLTDVVGESVII